MLRFSLIKTSHESIYGLVLSVNYKDLSTPRYNRSKDELTISGKPVSCSTLVTDIPALSKAEAVPPVEIILYLQDNR